MRRVLILTRTPGEQLWFPEFESRVLAETDRSVAVKRHWWTRREWFPKAGPFARASEIDDGHPAG